MSAAKKSKSAALSKKAQGLLDAQVGFTLGQLAPAELDELLATQWAMIESIAGGLTLNEVIEPQAVADAVLALYPEMDLTELAKSSLVEFALALHGHPIHAETTIADLVPETQFNAMVDWGLGQTEWRRALIHDLVTNPIFASMISEMLITGIREYVANSDVTDRVPGAKSALKIGKAFVNRAKPDLGSRVEENLKNYVERNAEGRLKSSEAYLNRLFDGDDLGRQIDAIWAKYSDMPVSKFIAMIDPNMADDAIRVGEIGWAHLRQTDWLAELTVAIVNSIFEQHGDTPFCELVAELGLTEEKLGAQAQLFARPILESLHNNGVLEQLVRAQLLPFYQSPTAVALLAD